MLPDEFFELRDLLTYIAKLTLEALELLVCVLEPAIGFRLLVIQVIHPAPNGVEPAIGLRLLVMHVVHFAPRRSRLPSTFR